MGESKRNRNSGKPQKASLALTRELVEGDDSARRRKFKQKLHAEIEGFIGAVSDAHKTLEAANASWPRRNRAQHVRLYLHAALNNLIVAVHLITSGYEQAGGQQFRNYAEAVSMAMLLLIDKEWEAFAAQLERYPAHDSMTRVTRKDVAKQLQALLGLEPERWRDFRVVARHYDHYAHAGAVSLAMHVKIVWPGLPILGGEYDEGKREDYRRHLRRALHASESLAALIRSIQKKIGSVSEESADLPRVGHKKGTQPRKA